MKQKKRFSELGIKSDYKGLKGDKINISRVFNKEITVEDFKIEKSKYNADPCLHMQILKDGIQHVIFTQSIILIENIKKVAKEDFPFITTIIKDNERFEFT